MRSCQNGRLLVLKGLLELIADRARLVWAAGGDNNRMPRILICKNILWITSESGLSSRSENTDRAPYKTPEGWIGIFLTKKKVQKLYFLWTFKNILDIHSYVSISWTLVHQFFFFLHNPLSKGLPVEYHPCQTRVQNLKG